jgi:hypothetical protein
MIILSNGYQLPETGDFGSIWFPAIESNIQRLNDHTHNGSDSNKLSSSSIDAVTQTVLAASFAPTANPNEFSASVTIPGAVLVDATNISLRDPTTKREIFAEIEKTSISQFNIITNFVQDFEVVFV